MTTPTLVRLLQDAEGELVRAADSVPDSLRDATGFDSAAYVLAHATETHGGWILGSVGGEDEDPWCERVWRLIDQGKFDESYADARAALGRVLERTTQLYSTLTDADLERPGQLPEDHRWHGAKNEYFVGRAIGHFFAHAADLNGMAIRAGTKDIGLPGRLRHTAG
jgi:hypothetical protein